MRKPINTFVRCAFVLGLVLTGGCVQTTEPTAVASTPPPAPPDPLVFDTWVPGPCSPNGQPQGQCPPGELFRVRLVPVAEGLTSPRNLSFMPDGDALVTELAGRVRLIHDGVLVAGAARRLARRRPRGRRASGRDRASAVRDQPQRLSLLRQERRRREDDARARARTLGRARSSRTCRKSSSPTRGSRAGRSRAAPCSGPTA